MQVGTDNTIEILTSPQSHSRIDSSQPSLRFCHKQSRLPRQFVEGNPELPAVIKRRDHIRINAT